MPGRVAGRRVDDDSGGLVDDEESLVLEGHAQGELLGLERRGRTDRQVERDLLPALEAVALRPHVAVDQHAAVADEAFGVRPRLDRLVSGQPPVEPLAGRGSRDGHHLGHVSEASGRRSGGRSGADRRTRR